MRYYLNIGDPHVADHKCACTTEEPADIIILEGWMLGFQADELSPVEGGDPDMQVCAVQEGRGLLTIRLSELTGESADSGWVSAVV